MSANHPNRRYGNLPRVDCYRTDFTTASRRTTSRRTARQLQHSSRRSDPGRSARGRESCHAGHDGMGPRASSGSALFRSGKHLGNRDEQLPCRNLAERLERREKSAVRDDAVGPVPLQRFGIQQPNQTRPPETGGRMHGRDQTGRTDGKGRPQVLSRQLVPDRQAANPLAAGGEDRVAQRRRKRW